MEEVRKKNALNPLEEKHASQRQMAFGVLSGRVWGMRVYALFLTMEVVHYFAAQKFPINSKLYTKLQAYALKTWGAGEVHYIIYVTSIV